MNPGWKCLLHDDTEISHFIDHEIGGNLAQLFHQLPLGVMKADVWRYAVLFKFGGIYADIDTTCTVALDSWQLTDHELWVALENEVHFCQWTIATVPRHPLLALVLQLVEERLLKGIDSTCEHFVHQDTGPGIWTAAIRQYLKLQHLTPRDIYEHHRESAAKLGVKILPACSFHGRLVDHAFGSRQYLDGYISWTAERIQLQTRSQTSS